MNGVHRVTKMVPWQESWSQTYEAEKKLISEAMEAAGLRGKVYHIGSTSVKGMISKPIIDILLCPEREISLDAFIPVLEGIGYVNLGECGRKDRHFLSKGDEENKSFYLHLCYEDHQVAKDQKLFQFVERNDPVVFCSYFRLKQALAELFPLDRDEYRSVKGMYIEGVLSAYRLGERKLTKKMQRELEPDVVDDRIKYWIYEFEMSDEARRQFEAACAVHEMTADEFFEAAVENGIHEAEEDSEGFKERCQKAEVDFGDAVRLVRSYPVYRGETEA